MSNILLIGNGFDLYHNMPTRYSDFMFLSGHWDIFKDKYDRCRTDDISPTYSVRLNKGCLSEESLDDFAAHKSTFDKKAIEYLSGKITSNKWVRYFRQYRIQGQNWYDFESEIERALENVEIFYSSVSIHSPGNSIIQNNPRVKDTIEFFCPDEDSNFREEVEQFADRIIQDEERQLAHKKKLLHEMRRELDDLNKCLCYYLAEFVCKIEASVKCPDLDGLEVDYLLNFNYTYMFKTIYGGYRYEYNHHQVHGGIMNNDMVLGIADEAFGKTNEYAYFQKYFQRIQKRTGSIYKEWITKPAASTISDKPNHVYIFGHSLGKSDDGVLREIFNSGHVEKITIFFNDQDSYENLVFNLVELFGREYVIKETGEGRIEFKKLSCPQTIIR